MEVPLRGTYPDRNEGRLYIGSLLFQEKKENEQNKRRDFSFVIPSYVPVGLRLCFVRVRLFEDNVANRINSVLLRY